MYSFKNSGLDGAGFQNVIDVDPFNGNNLIIGCDVAGFHYSRARGGAWKTGNRGLSLLSQMKIAAVQYSPVTQDKLYGVTGNKGAGGGFLVSVDGGRSWEVRSNVPQFSGGNTGSGFPTLPTPHPRSTGDLIALDTAGGRIYVGTFSQGVMRSDDDGYTWPVTVALGAGTKYIRTIALDPSDTSVLYVGTHGDGAWRITGANTGSPVTTQLVNAPVTVEGLKYIGTTLYAVCGAYGVFRVTSNGDTWTALNSGVDLTTSKWMSVNGHTSAGQDVIYIGCATPEKVPQGGGVAFAKAILKSVDSGATWTPITFDPAYVHTNYIGADGNPGQRDWWLPQTVSSILIHRNTFVAAHIAIDPQNTNRIYVSGRSGGWRSDDAGLNWYPMVQGLAVTINRGVAVDPNDANKVWIASTDWVIIKSTDKARNIIQDKPGPNTGYDLAFDTPTSRMYAAFGHRDENQNGKVYSKLYSATKWTDELIDAPPGFPLVVDSFDRTVSGGWGTPDTGPAYTHNTPASFAVSPTDGGQIALSGNQNLYALSTLGLDDVTAYCTVSWSALAAGGASQAELTIRQQATTTFYGFRVRNTTDGNITLVIRKNVSGTSTTIVNKSNLISGYAPGEIIHLRVNCLGTSPTTLRAKAWREGDDEPEEWNLETTDSEAVLQAAGDVTVRAISDSGYTANATYSYRSVEFMQIGEGGSGGRRPFGIAVGRDGSNNVVVLAALEQNGIWRKVSGTWTQLATTAMTTAQVAKMSPFSWIPGSQYVFLYDRASGVWRSSDYGATWSLIWNAVNNVEMSGYIAAMYSDPTVLWVTKSDGLYKLEGVDTGTSVGSGITSTLVAAVPRPGALAVSTDDIIYCTSKIGTGLATGENPGLYRSTDGGDTWQDVSDSTYQAIAGYPFRLAVGPDHSLQVSLNGNGVLTGVFIGDKLKTWNGSAWQNSVAKRWDGTDWVPYPVKTWDGSQWEL